MISVADILNKPKIILFPELRRDVFYKNCRAREKAIKDAHKTCLRSFNTLLVTFKEKKNELTKWEKEKIISCSHNLGEYLEYLVSELDKEKIENYCLLADKMGNRFIPFLSDIVLMMINSYQGAIKTDLHWVTDLTISDSIAISAGTFNFNKLKKYLPERVSQIKELCKELKDVEYVQSHIDSIKEAIQSYQANRLKSCNLLLLTTIEGLVRSLGTYLVKQQELNINPLNKNKYSSLASFINNIPWKKDLQISDIKHGLLNGNFSNDKLSKTGLVSVNLTERLGFLSRRFKENRNNILHGEETKYDNSLNSFLNFSALREVLLTIQEYQTIYKHKT